MSWVITPSNLLVDDQDALTYLAAVEAADGQALESGVRLAVNAFVKGCKADGIWPAIKASCILAGARTLTGALVPLVGTAPTNVDGLFVSGDYNRKTGLVGDGSTKYLDSNRNNNADPRNNNHNSVFSTSLGSGSFLGAVEAIGSSGNNILGATVVRNRNSNSDSITPVVSFYGASRALSSNYTVRTSGVSTDISSTSQSPSSSSVGIFRASNYGSHRLAFYSIGQSLNLALLDARVTDLINAFDAAI